MGRHHLAALLALLGLAAGCASSNSPSPAEAGPLQHYQMARMYFEQGRTDEALKEIDLSLRRDDSLPQVHFYKGFIYYSLGDMAKAVPCFEAAIQRDPYYTDARMYLAATGRMPPSPRTTPARKRPSRDATAPAQMRQ